MSKQNFNQEPEKYEGKEPVRKDYYDEMYSVLIRSNIETVIDLGCAGGDFLHWLPDNIVGIGVDKSKVLIERAERVNSRKINLQFIESDIFKLYSALPPSVFNSDRPTPSLVRNSAVTIFGTLSTFWDFRELLDYAISLRPKLILINDYLNIHGVDIQCGYRQSGSPNEDYNFGFNIVSKESLEGFLKSRSLTYEIEQFNLRTSLARTTNPLYTWTAYLDGEKCLTNGTGLVFNAFNIFIVNDVS